MADESVPFDDVDEAVTWITDSGLFIACGRQQNNRYTALERFARRNDLTFAIPQRVYDELGGAPDRSTPGQTPINSAIDAGWVPVADEPEYTDSMVSRVMDDVRSYVATSSNRDEDQIEKADTALGAVAVERLSNNDAEFVAVVTTDTDAGKDVVAALTANGSEDPTRFKDGFELTDGIV
jgi:hypothetical protein